MPFKLHLPEDKQISLKALRKQQLCIEQADHPSPEEVESLHAIKFVATILCSFLVDAHPIPDIRMEYRLNARAEELRSQTGPMQLPIIIQNFLPLSDVKFHAEFAIAHASAERLIVSAVEAATGESSYLLEFH